MKALACGAATLLIPLLAGAGGVREEMTLLHSLGGQPVGSEKVVLVTDAEAGVCTVTTEEDLAFPGAVLRLETTLRVKEPEGEILDYRIDALAGGQPQSNVMSRRESKLHFDIEAGGQKLSPEVDAAEPLVVLDNMVGAHYTLLLRRFGEAANEGVELHAVVPQRVAVVPATLTRLGEGAGVLDGEPIELEVYEITLANILTTIRAAREVPGWLLEVEVPLQQYRIARDGFERGEPARPEEESPPGFVSEELTVGSGELALGATLTLPEERDERVPGVALVHGSGPNDRDETIAGVNRPFRDLAEGLSARGIAVLRYDKRTFALKGRVEDERLLALASTLEGEVVDDAGTAVELLRARPEVDPDRVFVVGHSLGGMALPYILKQAEWLAGGVALAGSARPLDVLVIEQSRYLMETQEVTEEQMRERLAPIEEGFARIRSGEAAEGEFLMGAPTGYWRDILFREPAREAAALPHPILFLFGAKDYQVTSRELDVWRTACAEAGKGNASFKTFRDLNHLFMRVEGRSDGTEYQRPAHVAEEVLEEIASWVGEQQR